LADAAPSTPKPPPPDGAVGPADASSVGVPPTPASCGTPGHREIRALAFSRDGQQLVVASDVQELLVVRVADGVELAPLTLPYPIDDDVIFSRDGSTVMARPMYEEVVRIWRLPRTAPVAIIPVPQSVVRGPVTLSPDGTLVALAGQSGGLVVAEAATGKALLRLDASILPEALAFSPDDSLLAVRESLSLHLVKVRGGKRLWNVSLPLGVEVAFTADGQTLVAATPDGWALLRVTDGTVTGSVGDGERYGLALSPDSRLLLTGGHESRIWDLATGQLVARFPGAWAVAFAPDGATVALAGLGKLGAWRVSDGVAQFERGGFAERRYCLH
jgi:WD40 repeat protein